MACVPSSPVLLEAEPSKGVSGGGTNADAVSGDVCLLASGDKATSPGAERGDVGVSLDGRAICGV